MGLVAWSAVIIQSRFPSVWAYWSSLWCANSSCDITFSGQNLRGSASMELHCYRWEARLLFQGAWFSILRPKLKSFDLFFPNTLGNSVASISAWGHRKRLLPLCSLLDQILNFIPIPPYFSSMRPKTSNNALLHHDPYHHRPHCSSPFWLAQRFSDELFMGILHSGWKCLGGSLPLTLWPISMFCISWRTHHCARCWKIPEIWAW